MLLPHEVCVNGKIFTRLTADDEPEPRPDRGTGFVLRDIPVHAGAEIVPVRPEAAVHAVCCAYSRALASGVVLAVSLCDCGVYGFWKAVTGNK